MGEIADAMVNGEICEGGCGKVNPRQVEGVPWRCRTCRKDAQQEAHDPRPGTILQVPKKAGHTDPLPKWKLDSPLLVTVRYHCTRCTRHFGTDTGAVDHLRDVHGVSLP